MKTRLAVAVCLAIVAISLPGGTRSGLAGHAQTLATNAIQAENQKTGTTGWKLTCCSQDTVPRISGYAGVTSVAQGESIDLHVSTMDTSYDLQIYRMGWYGGLGGRLMGTISDLPGHDYPTPAPDPVTGTVDCNWPVGYQLNIPSTWTSGVYLAKLIGSSSKYQSYIPFVVRDDQQPHKILFQVGVSSWQAYNTWGGKSLYRDASAPTLDALRARVVSFNRPYVNGAGSFWQWDYPMLRWMERMGYDMSYATDVDLDLYAHILDGHEALVVGSHSEYWSAVMRARVEQAVQTGLNVANMSANTVYWQVRYQPVNGVPDRLLVCYRYFSEDPLANIEDPLVTVRWTDPPVLRPESQLLGLEYGGATLLAASGSNEYFPLVIAGDPAPLFSGTALEPGASLPGLVGPEFDRFGTDGGKFPVVGTLQFLAKSPVINNHGNSVQAASSLFQPSGALGHVFDAGTIGWSRGLDDFSGGNVLSWQLRRLTYNILAYLAPGSTSVSAPTQETYDMTPASVQLSVAGQSLPASPAFPGQVTVSADVAQPGNSSYITEYSTDDLTWTRYTAPFVVASDTTIQARTTNAEGVTGPTSSWQISILPPVTVTETPTSTKTPTSVPVPSATPTSTSTPSPTATTTIPRRPGRFVLSIRSVARSHGLVDIYVSVRGMHHKPIAGVAVTLVLPPLSHRTLHSKTNALGDAVFKLVRLTSPWKVHVIAKKVGWRELAVTIPVRSR